MGDAGPILLVTGRCAQTELSPSCGPCSSGSVGRRSHGRVSEVRLCWLTIPCLPISNHTEARGKMVNGHVVKYCDRTKGTCAVGREFLPYIQYPPPRQPLHPHHSWVLGALPETPYASPQPSLHNFIMFCQLLFPLTHLGDVACFPRGHRASPYSLWKATCPWSHGGPATWLRCCHLTWSLPSIRLSPVFNDRRQCRATILVRAQTPLCRYLLDPCLATALVNRCVHF